MLWGPASARTRSALSSAGRYAGNEIALSLFVTFSWSCRTRSRVMFYRESGG